MLWFSNTFSISVNSWRQHKNVFFPSFFLQQVGVKVCQYGQLSDNHPSELSYVVKPRALLRCMMGDAVLSPNHPSGQLVNAAERMKKAKRSTRGSRKKDKEEEEGGRRKEGGRKSHDEIDGDRSSLRHGSVSDGVSQCALGSAVLSSPGSWRPPPAPAWRPAFVSWPHRPAPAHTQSDKDTHTDILLRVLNRT